MAEAHREFTTMEVPRALAFGAGIVAGLLTAMVVQVLLGHGGVELGGLWRNMLSAQALQWRSAGVWWLIAGTALLTGALVAGILSRLSLPWIRFRLLRWVIGAAVVAGLAEVGHVSTETAGHATIGAHAGTTLAALCAAGLMAMFGAYFAVKR